MAKPEQSPRRGESGEVTVEDGRSVGGEIPDIAEGSARNLSDRFQAEIQAIQAAIEAVPVEASGVAADVAELKAILTEAASAYAEFTAAIRQEDGERGLEEGPRLPERLQAAFERIQGAREANQEKFRRDISELQALKQKLYGSGSIRNPDAAPLERGEIVASLGRFAEEFSSYDRKGDRESIRKTVDGVAGDVDFAAVERLKRELSEEYGALERKKDDEQSKFEDAVRKMMTEKSLSEDQVEEILNSGQGDEELLRLFKEGTEAINAIKERQDAFLESSELNAVDGALDWRRRISREFTNSLLGEADRFAWNGDEGGDAGLSDKGFRREIGDAFRDAVLPGIREKLGDPLPAAAKNFDPVSMLSALTSTQRGIISRERKEEIFAAAAGTDAVDESARRRFASEFAPERRFFLEVLADQGVYSTPDRLAAGQIDAASLRMYDAARAFFPLETVVDKDNLAFVDQVRSLAESLPRAVDEGDFLRIAHQASKNPELLSASLKLGAESGELAVELLLRSKPPESDGEALGRFSRDIASTIDSNILQDEAVRNAYLAHAEKLFRSSPEKREVFLNLLQRIDKSPSQSIQRVKSELISNLLETDDPEQALDRIEDIFVKNNLPEFAKRLKVFEVLHPRSVLEQKLQLSPELSPTLRAESHRGRMLTIYKDLVGINLDSGNRSLRAYLEVFIEAKDVLEKPFIAGIASLDAEEERAFEGAMGKIKTLYENSQLGRARAGAETASDAKRTFRELIRSLGVKEGQNVTERLAELFLKPVGLASAEEAIDRMDRARQGADDRNRRSVAEGGGALAFAPGDLLKGFDDGYFQNIVQNGSVAKEFLGPGSDSDATPFDTDVSIVLPADAEQGPRAAIEASLAKEYGDIAMLVRDRGQFQKTSSADDQRELGQAARERRTKLELFQTGVLGERHFGIRTGFASSEIDAFIVKDVMRDDAKKLDQLAMSIAENGLYVPIADADGKVLFTPEQFDDYRKRFFGGVGETSFELAPEREASEGHRRAIEGVMDEKRKEREALAASRQAVEGAIMHELTARGVVVSEGYAQVLTTAELYDTGSTGRGTNVPGSYDYDYVLKLNAKDIRDAAGINDGLAKAFGGKLHEGSRVEQLRVLGAKVGGLEADVDVAFVDKSELALYESHDAVKERLNTIGRENGVEAQERVVANIILAKKILKGAEAYKKVEQGGLGGIGVENWILANGGDVIAAFSSFNEASRDGDALVGLEKFRERYKILDPGLNAKKAGRHDNFIDNLNADGYKKMADAVKGYLTQALR